MNDRTSRAVLAGCLALVVVLLLGGWTLQRSRSFRRQTARIAEVLELQEGMTVADVGAGDGRYSAFLAERVGSSGRVFSTEVEQDKVEDIRDRVDEHDNVTVILGELDSTGLPDECCDRMLLRNVYHHFLDPDPMNRSMLAALKPGGVIAVVDFLPGGSHGTPTDQVIEEMSRSGFELVGEVEDWPGGRDDYCVLFRRPGG